MIDAAYWISPQNEIIPLNGQAGANHIAVVFNNPEMFGLTEDYLKEVYEKHGEPLRSEGKAREEIILDLVKKGWVRIRRYRNQHWSFTVARETKKIKDYIFDWAVKITDPSGLFGEREKDLYMPVKVYSALLNKINSYTVKEIMSGAMYESNEQFDEENLLVEKDLSKSRWVQLLKTNF